MSSVKRFWVAAAMLVAALPVIAGAQTRRISGTVTVQGSTEPVPGATIQVVGTQFGTTADDGGRFTLSIPGGTQQLRVRRIGFQAKVVPVGAGESAVTIGLTRDVLQLEAQVITGQATTVSRANAANAVTIVNTEALNRVPQQTVENALQGKVPGAVITQNSGAPGGGIQVQIRGANTINGSYQPLYVVDGVIVNNDAYANGLNAITGAGGGGTGQVGATIGGSQDQQVNRVADLNPEDIENIEVLKGPAAGAIYGSRGANGVVVITTKKGSAGKPSVNLTQRFGTTQLGHTLKMRCFTQAEATAYVDANLPGSYTSSAEYFKDYPYAGCTDPQETLYGGDHGLAYETSASVRGGSQSTTYFGSGTVRHEPGLAPNDLYNKQSVRLNLVQQLGSRVSANLSSEVLHTLTQRGISGNDNTTINPVTIYSSTPTFFNFAQRGANGDYVSNPWVGNNANILQDANQVKTPENVYRQIASGQLRWGLLASGLQTLDLTALGGVDHYTDASRVYSPPTTYIEQSGAISPYPGTIVNNDATVLNANLNLSLTHKLTTSAFTATTSTGLRQERAQNDYVTNLGNGLFPGITNFATAVQTASAEGQVLTKTFSYYVSEEFLTLSERLLLSAAVNAERSSTNGDVNKFYSYPKFSASYRLPWLPPKTDNLKLRVAYGQAGNRVPVDYKYTYLTPLPEGGINGLRASTTVGLASVKPELTNELEGGLDWSAFGGRVGLEYTRYQKKTTGLVLSAALAPSTGYTSQIINGGSLMNVGTEIGLNLTPIQSSRFTWNSNTTYSRNKGEVTSLPVPQFNTGSGFGQRFGSTRVAVGYPITQLVTFKGFDSTFVNGKYVSRARHEIFVGDESPDFTMGFTNDFTAGRFHLSTLVDWRKGGYLANLTNDYFDFDISGGNFADTAGRNLRATQYSKLGYPVYLEHASFAKLREVTLSYDLPPVIFGSMFGGKASSARLELSGHNLKTWTPYTGYDPEVSNFGNAVTGRIQDVTPYPPSRQYYLSVVATF